MFGGDCRLEVIRAEMMAGCGPHQVKHALRDHRLIPAAAILFLKSQQPAGVIHARGQAVGVRVPDQWTAPKLRRALNALLPEDVWVAAAHEMRPEFHARYSATSRRYAYHVGTDEDAYSPFRRRTEWAVLRPLARDVLDEAASHIVGEHRFIAFAVRGTAPARDSHRCTVSHARWLDRAGGLTFDIEANRFLHHMVRFLVGTMLDVASGRRSGDCIPHLLSADDNDEVSPPAPAHALFLESVSYPPSLYLNA